jgi:hypothetical protein
VYWTHGLSKMGLKLANVMATKDKPVLVNLMVVKGSAKCGRKVRPKLANGMSTKAQQGVAETCECHVHKGSARCGINMRGPRRISKVWPVLANVVAVKAQRGAVGACKYDGRCKVWPDRHSQMYWSQRRSRMWPVLSTDDH